MTKMRMSVTLDDGQTEIVISKEFVEEAEQITAAGGEVISRHSNVPEEFVLMVARMAAAMNATAS